MGDGRKLNDVLRWSPDRTWIDLSGTVTTYFNDDLLGLGRARFHHKRCTGEELTAEPPQVQHPREQQWSKRFWATSTPWRLRIEYADSTNEEQYEANEPYVQILTRRNWWSFRGTAVKSGRLPPDLILSSETAKWAVYGDEITPYQGEMKYSPGTENLPLLLKPFRIINAFHLSDPIPSSVAGRPGIQTKARPKAWERFISNAGGIVALGADAYSVTFDLSQSVVLDVTAFIDSQVALRVILSDLLVDSSLDEALFMPPEERSYL